MPATIHIMRMTTATPTYTCIEGTNARASTSDNVYTTETTNPIPIPASVSAGVSCTSIASTGTPPTFITCAPHHLAVGSIVVISGVSATNGTGNIVNDVWYVSTVPSATVFSISATNTNAYVSGGTIWPVAASFWVTTILSAQTSPANAISNTKWYTNGEPGWEASGVSCVAAVVNTYMSAKGVVGTTGWAMNRDSTFGLSSLSAPPAVRAWNYTSGAPLQVNAGTVCLSSQSGAITGYPVSYQILVTSSATQGTLPQATINWSYDET